MRNVNRGTFLEDQACDGVAMLWADSLEDLEKVLASKEMEILAADQANYAARNHSVLLYENDSEKVVMYERGGK